MAILEFLTLSYQVPLMLEEEQSQCGNEECDLKQELCTRILVIYPRDSLAPFPTLIPGGFKPVLEKHTSGYFICFAGCNSGAGKPSSFS